MLRIHPRIYRARTVRALIAIVLAAGISLLASNAAAQTDDTRWYGWQQITVDAASAGVLFWGASRSPRSDPLIIGGFVGLGLGGPTIHGLHGHPGKALGSLGLRVGAPLVAGIGTFALSIYALDHHPDTAFGHGILVTTVTFVAGMIVDWALLSHTPGEQGAETTAGQLRLRWHF